MSVQDKIDILKNVLLVVLKVAEIIAKALEQITSVIGDKN